MTTISLGSATDRGRRESNEDSLLAVSAQDPASAAENAMPMAGVSALLILADGMGGRARGLLASQTAVKMVYRELAHILAMRSECDSVYLESSLYNAVRHANARIQEMVAANSEAEGMGTTCTVALVTRGVIALAHVGDSRAYLLPAGGESIQMLTEDHSVVAGEVKAGRLTEDQARRSKFRNVITRAVGVEEEISPDFVIRDIDAGGSTLILSSDGLHGSVPDDVIERLARAADTPQAAAEELVREALARGAKDNVSVIVARIDYDESAPAEPFTKTGVRRTRRRQSRVAGNALAFILGLAIAAVSAWIALSELVKPRLTPIAAPTAPPQASIPAAVQAAGLPTANYAAPQPLLGRTVMGGILIPSQGDLLAVDPAAHEVLKIDPASGQILTAAPDTAHLGSLAPAEHYWASDSAGELYESQTNPPMVRKFSADGLFLRTIGQGVLAAPGALSVASNGDVYVIDAGTLKRIRAVPAPNRPPNSQALPGTPVPTSVAQPSGAPAPAAPTTSTGT